MNIVTHAQELTAEVTKRIKELSDRGREMSKERAGLLDQISKIEEASRTAADAGVPLDPQKTESRVVELRSRIAALDVEITELDVATKEALAKKEALGPLTKLAEVCRDSLRLEEIPELKSLTELHTRLRAKLMFQEKVATGCLLWLGDAHRPDWQATLPIKAEKKRMLRGFVPKALDWVPREWLPVQPHETGAGPDSAQSLLPAPGAALSQVYYIADEDDFRSLTETLTWVVEEKRQERANNWEWRTVTVPAIRGARWREPKECLTAYLGGAFADKVVDLDAGADAEVLPGLNDAILSATQADDESVYVSISELQTTAEIGKAVEKHFRAFIDAPWTDDTCGLLANFKYYCERGERPRFRNLAVAGAYGFRLRSRDHSWIKGNIYVVPENLPYNSSPTKVPEFKVEYGSVKGLRLGRLILHIEGESHD